MSHIINVTVGADPEVFVVNAETEEVMSAIGFIPGTKDQPFPITDKGHAIQTDNVMAEFCVPAALTASEMFGNILICLNTIDNMLPENMKVKVQASAYLDEEYLNNEQAKTFGCDPDFNAYTLMQNRSCDANTNLRSAGGHIHVGYKDPNFEDNIRLVKAMDLFLGLPSLLLDTDTERRKMYGKAGAFREKSYGMEYRVLSNFWISAAIKVEWVFNQLKTIINFINDGNEISDEDQMDIQLAINNNDKGLALKVMRKYNIQPTFNVTKLLTC